MSVKPGKFASTWVDPDDAPEWTDELFSRAELAEGGKVIRPATGTFAIKIMRDVTAKFEQTRAPRQKIAAPEAAQSHG